MDSNTRGGHTKWVHKGGRVARGPASAIFFHKHHPLNYGNMC